MDQCLKLISDHAKNTWDGFYLHCHAYLEMASKLKHQFKSTLKYEFLGKSYSSALFTGIALQHIDAELKKSSIFLLKFYTITL
ncbi:hypothetical protein [Acinetobacter sp. ANC 4558]|uniref:hypothetical protein n=1 Tax=Acinetobacter sp. ANC 4558 TaxID=1977876 RepID=UPI001D17A424|nr:hypothetical protein [Acinetobacter sp. ANC 4558]